MILAIEQFYEAFAAHGLLDNVRVRFMPSGRFAYVDGVFRSRPFDNFGGAVEDAMPSFKCPASLITDVKQRDEILVRGVNYKVATIEAPDDRGEVVLKLAEL